MDSLRRPGASVSGARMGERVSRVSLGCPHERLQVIDEDLGKSGAGSIERHGFQKLIAEIGLRNAGLVVSLDASRLARNNRDWHQLLELCSVFGVLIADGERLYDPCAYGTSEPGHWEGPPQLMCPRASGRSAWRLLIEASSPAVCRGAEREQRYHEVVEGMLHGRFVGLGVVLVAVVLP
jgi:hypothetical protein